MFIITMFASYVAVFQYVNPQRRGLFYHSGKDRMDNDIFAIFNHFIVVRHPEKGRRYIDAKIQCTQEHLLIQIKNECEKDVIFDSQTGLPFIKVFCMKVPSVPVS